MKGLWLEGDHRWHGQQAERQIQPSGSKIRSDARQLSVAERFPGSHIAPSARLRLKDVAKLLKVVLQRPLIRVKRNAADVDGGDLRRLHSWLAQPLGMYQHMH